MSKRLYEKLIDIEKEGLYPFHMPGHKRNVFKINDSNGFINKLQIDKAIFIGKDIVKLLNLKSRISFRENYLIPAIENGFVKMTLPNTPTSKNQAYYKD